MALSRAELDRLAEDILADRIIVGNVYCGRCGYNLRMLPYMGRCPECGGEYNARPLRMQGIFDARLVVLPASDIFAAILTLGLGATLILSGIRPMVEWRLFWGAVSMVLGVFFARSSWVCMARFFYFRRIARRIEMDEDE